MSMMYAPRNVRAVDFTQFGLENKYAKDGRRVAEGCIAADSARSLYNLASSSSLGGDIQSSKGPVFATAIVAGTMGAKKTADLIPFCHPIGLEDCRLEITSDEQHGTVQIDCYAAVTHKTGVEMEALCGASVAALTIYDMCKGISHAITIKETRLLSKTGGKSDIGPPPGGLV